MLGNERTSPNHCAILVLFADLSDRTANCRAKLRNFLSGSRPSRISEPRQESAHEMFL